MKSFLLLLTLTVMLISYMLFGGENYKEPMSVNDIPSQTETTIKPFIHNNMNIIPLYDYSIKALVLSKEKYRSGKEAKISKYDLALGWKEMADLNNVNKIKITQGNRWYRWKTEEMPIQRKKIEHNSSNHHIIHANKNILKKLDKIEKHHVVSMNGYLVKVTDPENKGWYWKSSTTRKDTGNGACEIFFVKTLDILN